VVRDHLQELFDNCIIYIYTFFVFYVLYFMFCVLCFVSIYAVFLSISMIIIYKIDLKSKCL